MAAAARELPEYCFDIAGGDPLEALSLALRFRELYDTHSVRRAKARRYGWKIGRPPTRNIRRGRRA